jgi:hypothetical protein
MNASELAFEKHPPPSASNPIISDKEFSVPTRSKSGLAPGQSEEVVEIARRPGLNEQERRDLVDGQLAIFVYGEIRFTDVFGRVQRTRYRYMLGGPHGVRSGGTLVACEDGNEVSLAGAAQFNDGFVGTARRSCSLPLISIGFSENDGHGG